MTKLSALRLLKDCHKNNIPIQMELPDGTIIKLPLSNKEIEELLPLEIEQTNELEKLRNRARQGIAPRKSA